MDQQFVDLIYESAFAPELWPKVLEGLAETVEAKGGVLFLANPAAKMMRWVASPSFQDIFGRFVSEGWTQRDTRLSRILSKHHAGFLTDYDLFEPDELERDECYALFKRPNGLGWGCGMALSLPTGDLLGVGVERSHERGLLERGFIQRLDALRPHLARSAFISARLQLERAEAAAEILAAIGLPALLLSNDAKVVAANRLVEALTGFIQWRARDRAALMDLQADRILRNGISSLEQGREVMALSFATRNTETGQVMVGHLIPIRGGARELFSRCTAILILTPAIAPEAPPVELIQSLFDLTAAEARIARGLAAGDTLDEIAAAGAVSRNTVRSQLRAALAKTGSERQSELVALLGGIMPRFVGPKS